jgi:hypothetical protein
VATTQVSLIREHTAAIKPPRALWVPFMLGRPFGVPNNAAFQQRVLLAVLALIDAPSGPVLVDYPEDAPAAADDFPGIACPVSFAQAAGEDIVAALVREVEELRPWHERAQARRGRTMVGLTMLAVDDAAKLIGQFLGDNAIAGLEGLDMAETVRLACEDVRTYYCEAASARPGTPDAAALQQWFWHETAGGRAIFAVHKQCLASADSALQKLCNFALVPRAVLMQSAKQAR